MLAAALLVGGPFAVAQRAQTLHTQSVEYWETTARDGSEWATWRGDHRFDHRLSDTTPTARPARNAQARQWPARAQAIDRAAPRPADRVSLDIFVHTRAEEVAYQAFEGWRTMSLASDGGFQTELPELLGVMPADTVPQVEAVLARLAAAPRRIDEELFWPKRGIALGWVPPRPVRLALNQPGRLPSSAGSS